MWLVLFIAFFAVFVLACIVYFAVALYIKKKRGIHKIDPDDPFEKMQNYQEKFNYDDYEIFVEPKPDGYLLLKTTKPIDGLKNINISLRKVVNQKVLTINSVSSDQEPNKNNLSCSFYSSGCPHQQSTSSGQNVCWKEGLYPEKYGQLYLFQRDFYKGQSDQETILCQIPSFAFNTEPQKPATYELRIKFSYQEGYHPIVGEALSHYSSDDQFKDKSVGSYVSALRLTTQYIYFKDGLIEDPYEGVYSTIACFMYWWLDKIYSDKYLDNKERDDQCSLQLKNFFNELMGSEQFGQMVENFKKLQEFKSESNLSSYLLSHNFVKELMREGHTNIIRSNVVAHLCNCMLELNGFNDMEDFEKLDDKYQSYKEQIQNELCVKEQSVGAFLKLKTITKNSKRFK